MPEVPISSTISVGMLHSKPSRRLGGGSGLERFDAEDCVGGGGSSISQERLEGLIS